MILPVILSGGSGTRLWPLSRELYPKQLLSLVDQNTMLQNTALRTDGIAGIGVPILVCNEEHRFMAAEQLRQIGINPSAILLEPVGRNTAPAVAIAALESISNGENFTLLVLPADHVINDVGAFHRAVEIGKFFAEKGKLVTFGVVPGGPETGYGYIRAKCRCSMSVDRAQSEGNKAADKEQKTIGANAYSVASFVEKPDRATAEKYLATGEYLWNSGIFMFTAQHYLDALELFAPDILSACRASYAGAIRDRDFTRLPYDAFAACRSDSIDYAVMERATDAVVIPLDAGWSDVGSWSALWDIGGQDASGNVIKGDVLVHGVKDCFISAESRLVAAVGLEDHVVVETADAVLIARKECVQDVKAIVTQLNTLKRREAVTHRKVYRPWGAYQSVDSAERFQVKRITVNPGASLSLQMHHHRAEHWVVVKGTARISRGDEIIMLTENQSVYIPLGVKHRLENPGVIPLELIEVQSGSYLGEDDIVRFEDAYGR